MLFFSECRKTAALLFTCFLSITLPAPAADRLQIDLSGKVAVVTGSSSGLGKALAELAAERGMHLVLADINLSPSEALAQRVRRRGGKAVAVEVDLAQAKQRPRVIATALDTFGRVDVLFNNAGYNYMATLEQMDLKAAHRLFEVNYWAYADLANRVIPIMKRQGGGIIVNIASILAHTPAPAGMRHYAATKQALFGLFEAASNEVATHNIKIRVASPGGMKTDIGRNTVGPLADSARKIPDDWEDPAIVAKDIFAKMQGDEVVFFPGAIGRQRK